MISIVIPAHNEEKRISRILEGYGNFFSGKKRKKEIKDFEIIVVLNDSKDKTEEIVKEFSKKYKEIRHIKFSQGGKGFAIIEGFKEALKGRGVDQIIGYTDADMSTPPEAFYNLVKKIDGYDAIIPDRWDRRSIINKRQTILRRFISRGYNFIVRTLFCFSYRDTQCGAKLFKREILERNINKIVSSQWNIDIALLFCIKKESDARIRVVPTIWHDEINSKVNLKKTPITMFASSVRLRLIHSPFRFLVKAYRRLPEKMKFH